MNDITADQTLIALGRELDKRAAEMDGDPSETNIAAFAQIESTILDCPARTLEGLFVKARAMCWARLGDLDPTQETTTDKRMGISIARDLIRMFDPRLEQPEALNRLRSWAAGESDERS